MNWKGITTLNHQSAVRDYAKRDIKANFGQTTGHWKHSIVCQIAAYGSYTMRAAWCIFFITLDDYLCETYSTEDYVKLSIFNN